MTGRLKIGGDWFQGGLICWKLVTPVDVSKTKKGTARPLLFVAGRGMWYSYQTCGGKDYWMTAEKKKELQVSICEQRLKVIGDC